MLSISWDTLEKLAWLALSGVWGATLIAMKWLHNDLNKRLRALEEGKAGTAEVRRVAEDVAKVSADVAHVARDLEVVRRVLFAVAHKLDIPVIAESLNK